jgi:SAM-dependent methyltransferase
MRYWSLGHRLPYFISRPLFGDRRKFGTRVQLDDPDWLEWDRVMPDIYPKISHEGFFAQLNQSGYKILNNIDLDQKDILEIGPGDIQHSQYWKGTPRYYALADVHEEFLTNSQAFLNSKNIPSTTATIDRTSPTLAYPNAKFDMVIAFYCFEHAAEIDSLLSEVERVLKPGGLLIGGIPTEGGLAWGLGRYLTTRRHLLRHTSINPDKKVCWDHPQFAETILALLEKRFLKEEIHFWPFGLPVIDANLIISFVMQKQ